MPDESAPQPTASDQPGKVVRRLRAEIDHARTSEDHFPLRLELGRALMAQTRFDEAARELESLIAEPAVAPSLQAAARGLLAGALVLSGRPTEGEAVAQMALASEDSDREARVHARSAVRGIRFFEGRFDAAVELAQLIARDAADAGATARGEARLDMGGMLSHTDRWDEAERWLRLDDDATDAQRQEAAVLAAQVDLARGRWHAVLDAFPAPGGERDADWSDLSRVFRPALRSMALIHLDRAEQARREMGRPTVNAAPMVAIVASALLAEVEGDLAAVGALVERAVALNDRPPGQRPQVRLWAIDLVRLAMAAGERATAERVVHCVEQLSRLSAVASVSAAALAARGIVERDVEALAQGVDLFSRGPRVVATAQASDELGVAFRERGDDQGAIDAFRRALGIWESVGAAADVRRTASALRELGIRTRPMARPRALRTGWDSLSRTEATVATLVAEGMTNAEIAIRLVVSRRTVETHVAHVLAKLDVPNRAGIARLAAERSR